MNADVARYRQRLESALQQADNALALAQAELASATVMLDQSSVGRLSRMDALQQQAMASGIRERLLQRRLKLKAALDRIDAGRYGICCQCEGQLEQARLEQDPAAVFCAACMTEREIHGDRIGDH